MRSLWWCNATELSVCCGRQEVNLRFVPTDAPRHPGNSGSFTILTGDGPDVAHAEIVHTGMFVTAPRDVARYRMLFGALQGAAISPDATLEAFRVEMKRLEHE